MITHYIHSTYLSLLFYLEIIDNEMKNELMNRQFYIHVHILSSFHYIISSLLKIPLLHLSSHKFSILGEFCTLFPSLPLSILFRPTVILNHTPKVNLLFFEQYVIHLNETKLQSTNFFSLGIRSYEPNKCTLSTARPLYTFNLLILKTLSYIPCIGSTLVGMPSQPTHRKTRL